MENYTTTEVYSNTTVSDTMATSSYLNTSFEGLVNVTEAPVRPARGGPPPRGYYGDTRETLWKVIPPIIIVWGTIGNVLTVLVLFRQRKMSSTALFLFALAVSDLVILYSGPLRNWVRVEWEKDIRTLSDSGCKAQLYLTYCSIQLSSWLLVAVTWERTMSVLLPHKVRLCCTPRRALVAIGGILVFILGYNMVIPIIMSLDGVGTYVCAPRTQEYRDFRDNVFQWMDFTMSFALPGVLLLAGNCVIVFQLRRSRLNQRQMNVSHGKKDGSTRDTTSVSFLMITLCVVFFLTMTPSTALQIYYPIRLDQITELFKTDPITAWNDYQYFLFLHAVSNIVGYTNASFNFILYVFSGSKFRSELKALFCCRQPPLHGAFGSKVQGQTSSGKNTSSTATTKESNIYVADGQRKRVNRESSLTAKSEKVDSEEVRKLTGRENLSFEED